MGAEEQRGRNTMKGEESGQEMKREIERGSRGMRGVEQMERNLEEQRELRVINVNG